MCLSPVFSLSLSLSLALSIFSLLLSRSHSSYRSSRIGCKSSRICCSSSSKNNIKLHEYAFIYLPIHLYVYLSIYLYIYLSIYPSILMYMPILLLLTHVLSCIQPHTQGALLLSPLLPSLPLDHSSSLSFLFLFSLLYSPYMKLPMKQMLLHVRCSSTGARYGRYG